MGLVTYAEGKVSEKRRSKLLPRGDGPFQVLERINDNAYKLDLPGQYNVSATFNVPDLSPFDTGEDLRALQEEGNDKAKDPVLVPVGPVTRARAKEVQGGFKYFSATNCHRGRRVYVLGNYK